MSQLPRLRLADRILALESPRQLHRLTHGLPECQRSAETLTTPHHSSVVA